VIEEPRGGAHYDPAVTGQRILETLTPAFAELKPLTGDALMENRYAKFRRIGAYTETKARAAASAGIE